MAKNKFILWISVFYIAITTAINLYGYFNLPDVIATQFSMTGNDNVNHMPAPVYLIGTFFLISIFSVFTITKSKEQKLKYLLINSILVIANVAMILSQI